MIEYEILNLEEIKDMISSFNDLQSAFNLLNSISDEFNTYDIDIDELNVSKGMLADLKTIANSIQSLVDNLLSVTNHNIHIFNKFQNELLSKFKRTYKERLKNLELNKNNLQRFGNALIKNKNVSKIGSNISFIYSLRLTQWLELIDSLKQNSIFNNIIQNLNKFYLELIEDKLNKQLSTIQGSFDESIINDYKEAFYKQPNLNFSEYQNLHKTSLSKEELDEKKDIIERERDKLELERLKENQVKQDELYQDYLKLPSKEFERKRRKKRREKLSKIDLKKNNNKKLEISKETYEKIEKYKSNIDKSLKNKYSVQEIEEKSPIELIRERKKKKSEEFKTYKKHFEAE